MGNDGALGNSLLSAAAGDLALTLSASPAGGLPSYSPYVSAVREIFGIFSAMHTAHTSIFRRWTCRAATKWRWC